MEQPGSDIVLGIPWLQAANPMIDWAENKIYFVKGSNLNKLYSVLNSPEGVEIFAMSVKETREELKNSDAKILWSRQVKDDWDPVTKISIPKEYKDFEELFTAVKDQNTLPKHQEWDHEIKIMENCTPMKQPIYSLSPQKLDALREYLEKNLQKEFIWESKSPARYSILFVPKSDGSLRLCVDYWALNNITVKNSYSLPLISELQDRFQGAQWFMKFDILGAFNQIRIKEGDEWKTAFWTRSGLYEYLVMPFRLTNAPATFQAFINNVLWEYLNQFVIIYFDDILIYSKTKEQHVQHVCKVLQALQDAGLQVKSEKSLFHCKEVHFLGFIVTSEGLQMNSEKIQSVVKWPVLKNVKEVQSFLEFVNFYRKFIEKYSKIASPLTELTRKDQKFEWSPEAQKAFDELKKRFTSQSILVSFDPEKPITLETDVSDRAIGACISQSDDKECLQPVAFYSRKFLSAEMSYEIHDKELLAIVNAFKQWCVYLKGLKHEVQVYSDHKNLLYFITMKVLNRRQVRWSEELSQYNFRIHYQKGSENIKVNALSQWADYLQDKLIVSHAILREDEQGNMSFNRQFNLTIWVENDIFENEIRKVLKNDKLAQQVLQNIRDHKSFEKEKGLLLFQGLVYVPVSLQRKLIEESHSNKTHGHQGIDKTIERLTRTYYFSHMRKKVKEIVRKCDICWRSKADQHKPYGLLKSLRTSERPWASITLNFVIKLLKLKEPLTKAVYDSILVITDRLTKYRYFIPYKEASSAEKLAYMFLRVIAANHRLPEEIISNRDKLFTFKFWKSLVNQLGIHHKLSTSYHP